MNIALWIVQVLVAIAFLGAGIMKLVSPLDRLRKNMSWIDGLPTGTNSVRVIGALEVLGALGLILPAVTHILPWLVPVAAACLVLTMIFAAILHVQRKEFSGIGAPVVLLILALIIVFGRFLIVPLS